MRNDLMLFIIFLLFFGIIDLSYGQQTIIYVKRGETADVCDDRPTSIFAYTYRSFDGKRTFIVEPLKHERYSNPYQTSLLRITNVTESDSGLYKCPQDDTEWQKLQVYVPVQYVHLKNLHPSSRVHGNELCGIENNNCLAMVQGEPLDLLCTADGYPRPAFDISIDKNGTKPTVMALAGTTPTGNNIPQSGFSESYRIIGLTPEDNGRNITCLVDMKHIDKNLSLSSTKQLYIEFAPKVIEKSKKIYCGINQTRTINCTVQRANPSYIRYSINGLSPSVPRRTYGDQNELQYTFDITPTALEHFRSFNVTANNSIGFDTCSYELIHGGIPDPITQCDVDTYSSNVTITISCTKSYPQGDPDGYACTLFKYSDKNNQKMFEEIARTKSCIFALENFHEPVEFRVAAFNRFGSLPVNTYGHIIRLNQPTLSRATPFIDRRVAIIIGGILGVALFLIFLCCLCRCCSQDTTKSPTKQDYYHNQKYARSTNEAEALKPTDDTIGNLVLINDENRSHQNGTVYDVPTHANTSKYPPQTSSTPLNSAYHQQKSNNYVDGDSISSSLNSIPIRTRTVNNKFYGHPVVDHRYGQLSPTTMVVPTSAKRNRHEHDDEEGDESPVYSTTTDLMSESGSFLVPSSSKRNGPPPAPPLKPRYSTLSSLRSPIENIDKTPLPKPRSRSNSRTRLNNLNGENSSYLYEERPISSSDSGIGPADVICLPNGDTIRTGLVKSRQDTLQTRPVIPNTQQQQPVRYQTLTSPVVHGTEC